MRSWIQLTPKQAHFRYRVPIELATDETNIFYGTERQPESSPFDDGPWPFLAFLREKERQDVVTFHIYNIDFEFLEFEDFNPLTAPSSYLDLNKQALSDLVNLLLAYAPSLAIPDNATNATEQMFRQLAGSELVDFHLHPEISGLHAAT